MPQTSRFVTLAGVEIAFSRVNCILEVRHDRLCFSPSLFDNETSEGLVSVPEFHAIDIHCS